MATSAAKKQGITAHLRRLALLHGYHARRNHLAEYQPRQNRGERIALVPPAPTPALLPAKGTSGHHAREAKKGMNCLGCSGCGGRCSKKNLLPAAAALNGYMRRNGKTLGDLGFDFSDFADAFGKVATGVTGAISAAKGINTNPNAKAATPPPAQAAPQKSSMPSWLLPVGAAAGGVALVVALTRH